jgi:hypothetical protein
MAEQNHAKGQFAYRLSLEVDKAVAIDKDLAGQYDKLSADQGDAGAASKELYGEYLDKSRLSWN